MRQIAEMMPGMPYKPTPHICPSLSPGFGYAKMKAYPETQKAVVKALKKEGVIRLKKNETVGKLTLPTKLAGKCSQVLHKWCDIKKQDYGGGKMGATIAFTPAGSSRKCICVMALVHTSGFCG